MMKAGQSISQQQILNEHDLKKYSLQKKQNMNIFLIDAAMRQDMENQICQGSRTVNCAYVRQEIANMNETTDAQS